jgi:hypothetical protein
MKTKFAVLIAGLLTIGLAAQTQLATAATATKEKTAAAVPAGTAHIRLLQAVPDGPALKVDLNDKTVTDNLAANTVSQYFDVPSGKCHFVFTGADGKTKVWNSTRPVKPDAYYTAAIYLDEGKTSLKLQDESSTKITAGKARIYFYNLSPDAGDLHITVASKRAKAGYTQWLKRVHPGSANSKSAATGDFTLQIRQGEKIIKEIPDFKVAAGQRASVYVLGKADSLMVVTKNAGSQKIAAVDEK